jgi:hypothetical protein
VNCVGRQDRGPENGRDEATIRREDTKATLAGKIDSDGTRFGSADGSRSMVAIGSRSRSRCDCGCDARATHVGLGDGCALMSGCEMEVRRWVRDGYDYAELLRRMERNRAGRGKS